VPFIGDGSKESEIQFQYNDKNISMAMPALFDWLSGKDVS
jgi:hypothetical protein